MSNITPATLHEGLVALHKKVDDIQEIVDDIHRLLENGTGTASGGGKFHKWEGDLPSNYVRAVATWSNDKDIDGNKTGKLSICVPTHLLTPEGAFARDGDKAIVPVKAASGDISLVAVPDSAPLSATFTGSYDNEGLECAFVREGDYLKIWRDNPYKAPNAGTQPFDPAGNAGVPAQGTEQPW